MVFDSVVCPTFKNLGNFGPFVAISQVLKEKDPFFLMRPTDRFDFRIQMIVPPFPTLFANSTW